MQGCDLQARAWACDGALQVQGRTGLPSSGPSRLESLLALHWALQPIMSLEQNPPPLQLGSDFVALPSQVGSHHHRRSSSTGQ